MQEKLLEGIVGTNEDETFITSMRESLAAGELEGTNIEVDVSAKSSSGDRGAMFTIDSQNPGLFASEIQKMSQSFSGDKRKAQKKKMTVAEARPIIEENMTERLMDEHDIPKEAIALVEVSCNFFLV